MAERRARLLQVKIQADFVIDDGDSLTPWAGPIVDIEGADWQEFTKKAFNAADLEAVLEQYEVSRGLRAPEAPPKPNRAARRAKKPKQNKKEPIK